VKDENRDLLANSNKILHRLENYFPQLVNAHNVSEVVQIKVHTAEQTVSGPQVVFGLKLVLQSMKSINRRVMIKFRQN
jgi:hypothetical protein